MEEDCGRGQGLSWAVGRGGGERERKVEINIEKDLG